MDKLAQYWPTLSHYLQLTRIYTWPDVIATAILGYLITSRHPDWLFFASTIAPLALGLWFLLNWVSEIKQRDIGRRSPPVWLAVCLPIVMGIRGILLLDSRGWIVVCVFVLLTVIYPYKKYSRAVAAVCFLIRGLQTATMLLLVASLGGKWSPYVWQTAAGTLLLQASRSLMAEVRDAPFDRMGLLYELRALGMKREDLACLVLAGTLSILAVPLLGLATWLPLAVFLIVILFYEGLGHGREFEAVASYHAHRWFVTASVVMKLLVVGQQALWMPAVMTLCAFLVGIATYSQVPRPINALVLEHIRREEIVRWNPLRTVLFGGEPVLADDRQKANGCK